MSMGGSTDISTKVDQNERYIDIKATYGSHVSWNRDYLYYPAGYVNVYIDFELKNKPEIINSFVVEYFSFDGAGMISLNDSPAYVYPYGDRLDVIGEYKEFKWGKKNKNTKRFQYINTGSGWAAVHKDVSGSRTLRNINLKPYLKEGSNRIHVKGVNTFNGSVQIRIRFAKKICLKWQDEWREECTLQKY
jgi:hypothetical protein